MKAQLTTRAVMMEGSKGIEQRADKAIRDQSQTLIWSQVNKKLQTTFSKTQEFQQRNLKPKSLKRKKGGIKETKAFQLRTT